ARRALARVSRRGAMEPRGDRGTGAAARLAADRVARRGRRLLPLPARRAGLSTVRIRIRTVAWAAAVLVAFAVGVALGEALHDSPGGGDTSTLVRTLSPLPIAPVGKTVTVTVSQP